MRIKINTVLGLIVVIVTLFLSCNNIEESIERDIFITPTGVPFTIPIITNTESGALLGDITVKNLNLDSLINNASSRFGLKNVKKIRMKDFKLELLDSDSLNNIQNIGNIIVTIQIAGQTARTIATTIPPNTRSEKLTIPIISEAAEVGDFIKSESFNYNITCTMRTVTTKTLKAKATATYSITVGL